MYYAYLIIDKKGIEIEAEDSDLKKNYNTEYQIELKTVYQLKKSLFKKDNDAFSIIADIMYKNTTIQNAIEFVRNVKNEGEKNNAYKHLTFELAKKENWPLAESTSLEISLKHEFQSCWKEIAKTQIEEKGAVSGLETFYHLQNNEIRKYYLKGWAENVTVNDLTEVLLLQALPLLKDDPELIEHLLQTHAINELFFGEASKEEIQKYNRTLNIQWALDIKSKF